MNEEDFNRLVDEIVSQGWDEGIAADFAARIGDTPVLDAAGLVVVQGDNGEVLARLRPLRFFGSTN